MPNLLKKSLTLQQSRLCTTQGQGDQGLSLNQKQCSVMVDSSNILIKVIFEESKSLNPILMEWLCNKSVLILQNNA